LLLAWLGYKWYLDHDLQSAIAEADRLDPGWRLFELEAARPEVPDKENSALQVLAAKKVLPARWFSKPGGIFSTKLEEDLDGLLAIERLNESQLKQVQSELAKASAALAVARRVADMPRGQYVVVWSPDAIGTLMPHLQEVGAIRLLLRLDAIRREETGDIEGALISCRAILNTGRSIGDEPTAISQLVRLSCWKVAVRGLERTLAQGESSELTLEALQRLLEDEAEQPLLLLLARSERATIHQFLEVAEAGRFDRATYGMMSRTRSYKLDNFLDRAKARGCHSAYLRFLTECVEIAKLPPEEQVERFKKLEMKEPEFVPEIMAGFNKDSGFKILAATFHRNLAFLRCSIVAVAVERYRLANGRWPERLDDLVPRYLTKIPTDLYDGQPLRYRRVPDGVLIYTVGEDGKDDGGRRVRIKAGSPDADVGFQLWDPERRHQTPRPK